VGERAWANDFMAEHSWLSSAMGQDQHRVDPVDDSD